MRGLRSGFKRPFSRLSDRVGVGSKIAAPQLFKFRTPGPFSWTAPADGIARVSATAGGGGGSIYVGSNAYYPGGGGGGAYGRSVVRVKKGDVISGTIGAGGAAKSGNGDPGSNTTVTFPNGAVGTCGAGQGGIFATSAATDGGGLGGTATGFDVNSAGAKGASGGNSMALTGAAENGWPAFAGNGRLSDTTDSGVGGPAGGDPEYNPNGVGGPSHTRFQVDPEDCIGGGGSGKKQSSGTATGHNGGNGAVSIIFISLEE